jgi:pimeloyl-ACP methyl ester carboxylesterase
LSGRLWRSYVGRPGGERLVRRGGEGGVPVVVVHGDMESSAAVADLAFELARSRSVIALDVAGCGDSAALDGKPTIEAYAADLAAVCAAAGLRTFDLYGVGIGGTLALTLAKGHGAAVRRIVLDRPWAPGADERDDLIANYAPPIAARWDGTHFLTAWHMLRDRALFWPWYRRTREAIRWVDPPFDPDALQRDLVELLKRPASYGDYCRAALAADPTVQVGSVSNPILVAALRNDRLASHADRFAGPNVRRADSQTDPADRARSITNFLDQP